MNYDSKKIESTDKQKDLLDAVVSTHTKTQQTSAAQKLWTLGSHGPDPVDAREILNAYTLDGRVTSANTVDGIIHSVEL